LTIRAATANRVDAMPRKSDHDPRAHTAGAVKPQEPRLRVEVSSAASGDERPGSSDLMEKTRERQNLRTALKHARQNPGGPSIDGITVEALPDHLRGHCPRMRQELRAGTLPAAPVKRVTPRRTDENGRRLPSPPAPHAIDRVGDHMVPPCLISPIVFWSSSM
jgi:hypothetical protein